MSYFSLTNISNQPERGELSDTLSYYSEQNLQYKLSDTLPIDLTIQYNLRNGEDNDRLRFGFRWRFNDTTVLKPAFEAINLAYSINFHVLQLDDVEENIWQMEHVFRLTFPYISERLYLAGFIDHTFNQKTGAGVPSNPAVAEAQLGFRLYENFYIVGEYRVNQFRRSDVNNVALGIEYKIRW